MNICLLSEVRRLAEIEKLSSWAISHRLHCSRHTVAKALRSRENKCCKSTAFIVER